MRCPLTVKFGKDVAGLIQRMVWRSYIKQVNNEYHSMFFWSIVNGYLIKKDSFFGINDRSPVDDVRGYHIQTMYV
jgi:hypothetical protein